MDSISNTSVQFQFQIIKDNCNPIFDETFEYFLSQGELGNKQLEVTVGTQKALFSTGNILGQVQNSQILSNMLL